jgi:hypothetical protein
MPDGLTTTPAHDSLDAPPARTRRPTWVVLALQALVVVVVFAVVGVLAGWLWFHVWDVPQGVVSGGQWFTGEAGLRATFAGTAWYVTIAVVAGLVLGVLFAGLFHRSELVTLAAVVVGSVLAGYLMLRVGQHLSPPDPQVAARTAEDGTRLSGALRVRTWPPRAAFPFGALVGLAIVYAASISRTPSEVKPSDSGSFEGTRG